MKYEIVITRKFKKSLKRLRKSGIFHAEKFDEAIDILSHGESMPAKFHDHSLTGTFAGYRECHITGDLLLIYRTDISIGIVYLDDIGSLPYLFGI